MKLYFNLYYIIKFHHNHIHQLKNDKIIYIVERDD